VTHNGCEVEIRFSPDYPPLRQRVGELSAERLTLPGAMIVPGGVRVEVRLRLPGLPRPLRVWGLVEPIPDAGAFEIRFERLSAAARAAIEEFSGVPLGR
jgi:hypothetical protein